MDIEKYYKLLKKTQEKKGYFFNKDEELVQAILTGLLLNKQRYGYTSCPCRLATADKEKDAAIICPCNFREKDVKLYGRCFCNLFVCEKVNSGEKQAADNVPERWLRD